MSTKYNNNMPSPQLCSSHSSVEILLLFALAILVCLPTLLWHDWPSPDAAIYYLPMIREFRAGNWSGAWYHMIPPLFILLAGSMATLFSLSAMFAGKLVSILFFAASVFPLYRILQSIYGHKTARIGCLLMIFCHRLIRNSAAPLLDSTKMFFFLLSTLLVIESFRRPSSRLSILAMSASVTGLALIRGEGAGLSIIAISAFAVAEIRHRVKDKLKKKPLLNYLPWRSFATALLFVIFTMPWTVYMYKETGYPVFDSRQIQRFENSFFQRFCHTESEHEYSLLQNEVKEISFEGKDKLLFKASLFNFEIPSELLSELYKGIHRYYIPLYIIGIWTIIKHKRWNRLDWTLGGIFLGHTFFMLIAVGWLWTQARYILPATPLLFGWGAVGVQVIIDQTAKVWPRHHYKILTPIISLIALLSIYSGNYHFQFFRSSNPYSEEKSIISAADWIKNEGRKLIDQDRPPLQSTATRYHSARRPVLLTAHTNLPFLAASDVVYLDHEALNLSPAELIYYAQSKTIDFIVIDKEWRHFHDLSHEDLAPYSEATVVKNFGQDENEVSIFKISPPE